MTNNILDELSKFVPAKNKHVVIESRATHVIASVNNLVQLINESYTVEESEELIKRLYRSIISGDEKKFSRKIREIKESK